VATSATPNPHFIPNWWNPRHVAEAARNQWSQRNQLKPQLERVKDQKKYWYQKKYPKGSKKYYWYTKKYPRETYTLINQ